MTKPRGRPPEQAQPARSVSVYVSEDVYQRVRKLAHDRGLTMTEVVRRGMRRLAESAERKSQGET